eukprot:3421860-Rhodomonas_salina.2
MSLLLLLLLLLAGVRHRGRARGNRGALHAEEVLREERMAQARMEEQLSAMTRCVCSRPTRLLRHLRYCGSVWCYRPTCLLLY